MGGGLFLMVIGAIVAFALNDNVPGLNLTVTGIILMLAGAVVIVHARQREHERDVERRRALDIEEEAVEHHAEPQTPAPRVVTEVMDWPLSRRRPPAGPEVPDEDGRSAP